MLLTREVLRDRNVWLLPGLLKDGSLKMVSIKTESTVNVEPSNESKLESSRPLLWAVLPVRGRLVDLGRAGVGVGAGGYSLDAACPRWLALVGAGSTDTGARVSLDIKSWMLVRRVEPSAVEMTLLARGSVDEEASKRSDTETALPWAFSAGRMGLEPLMRVLSALRRLGRPALDARLSEVESVTGALPLAERRMPRVPRSRRTTSLASADSREDSVARVSWLPF